MLEVRLRALAPVPRKYLGQAVAMSAGERRQRIFREIPHVQGSLVGWGVPATCAHMKPTL